MDESEGLEHFHQEFIPLLDLIDEGLGLDDVPVSQRTIKAAQQLVDNFIPSVKAGDSPEQEPGDFNEYSSEPWFKAIYGHVEKWYRWRYGGRLEATSTTTMRGVILIKNTPYLILVPVTRSKPEAIGETSWLSFPNQVLPEEDVYSWVLNPPRWESYQTQDQKKIHSSLREVSTLLRRISSKKIGAKISDNTVRNLLAGVVIHLNSASTLIFRDDDEGGFARAQWELQMACESAYKGLLQQKNGTFQETHDLFTIHDQSQIQEKSVRRQWIKELPRWNEAANLRYGLGSHPSTVLIFRWYKLTLKIIAGVFDNLDGIDLSDARLLLKIAPWLSSDESKT